MSIQVERIKSKFEELFLNYVDMSDEDESRIDDFKNKLNSRRLAAYAVLLKTNSAPEIAAKSITDGGQDCGIDAIFNDENKKELLLVQAKWSNEGNGTISQGDTLKFVSGIEKIIGLDFDGVNPKILCKKNDVEKAISSMDYKIRVVVIYTSNNPLPDEAESELLKLEERVNDDVNELICHETIRLEDIYKALAAASGTGDISIDDVVLRNWGMIYGLDDNPRGYYGMVSASQIAEWWKIHNNMLLDKNIRYFKGDTEVNKGIEKVLLNEPENFICYNNGIKIIAKRITRKLKSSTSHDMGLFTLEGVSIVNGAQTTGSIGETYVGHEDTVSNANVMVQIISLEGTGEKFGSTVTKLSNTQNRIESKDFVTMDSFQEKLRIDLLLDGIEYTYKDGHNISTSAKNCNLDDVAISVGCSTDDISLIALMKRQYGALFENVEKAPYKTIFNQSHNTYKIWNCVSVYRVFEKCNSQYQDEVAGIHRLVSIHANRYLLHLILKSFMKKNTDFDKRYLDIDDGMISEIKTWLGEYVDAIINAKNDLFPDAYPANIFKNANRCKLIDERISTL